MITEEQAAARDKEYYKTHQNEMQELQFVMKMFGGSVHFAYRKNNGELRIAYGTQALELIPEESHPKGTGTGPVHYSVYWDLNSKGWRAFALSQLVWIDGIFEAEPGALDEETERALAEYKKANGLV